MRKKTLVFTLLFFVNINATFAANFFSSPVNLNKINPNQYSFELKPGENGTEKILIHNSGNEDAYFSVKGVDPIKSSTGSVSYKSSTGDQTESGKWVKAEDKPIFIPKNESKQTSFTIEVPPNTPEGDYLAGLETMYITTTALKEGEVRINTRIVNKINIKVTNNPQPIEKLPPPPLFTPIQLYFYISATIFLLVVIWYGVKYIRAKKSAHKKAHSEHPHTHHPEHKK